MAHRFDSEHAIRAVLGLIPPEVQALGGQVQRGEDGSLVVEAALPTDIASALGAAGVGEVPWNDGVPFAHWGALLTPEVDPDLSLGEVLFVLPPGQSWLELASELLRLRSMDQYLTRLDGERWAIRSTDPSFYVVDGAADQGIGVFRRSGGLWVARGRLHPAADRVVLPEGTLVLVQPDGRWERVHVAPWIAIEDLVYHEVPAATPHPVAPPSGGLKVDLRLVPTSRQGAPQLWSILHDPDDTLQRLASTLPEAVVVQLEFARLEQPDGTHMALLRVRPGGPTLVLDQHDAFAVHPHLGGLFLPWGQTLEPPLQAGTVRRLLDPGAGRIGWIVAHDGGIQLQVVQERAFQRLSDHVLYRLDRRADDVVAWMGSTLFDWEPIGLPVLGGTKPEAKPMTEVRSGPRPERQRRATPAMPAHRPAPDVPDVGFDFILPEPSALESTLRALQQSCLDEGGTVERWAQMAEIHLALSQHREAMVCWSSALWELPADAARPLIVRWAGLVPLPEGLSDEPSPAEVAAVIPHVLAGTELGPPQGLQRWLDRHDALLDVRTRWIVGWRIAQLAGGDELGLARTRDRVLASIRNGQVLARDVPSFLRTSIDPDEREALLGSLAWMVDHLPGLSEGSAGPQGPTLAYAQLMVAWAQARLGDSGPYEVAARLARSSLPLDDEVHRVLFGLLRGRIEAVLSGLPDEAPPPAEVQRELDALDTFPRYVVDRLRSQSLAILADPGVGNPFDNYIRQGELDTSLEGLPPDALRTALHDLLADDVVEPEALQRSLALMVGLPEADSVPLLDRAVAHSLDLSPADGLSVWIDVTRVAAALSRPRAAAALLPTVRAGLMEVVADSPDQAIPFVRALVRPLIRCGLSGEGRAIMEGLAAACGGEDAWTARLRLAGAVAQLGGEGTTEVARGRERLEGPLQLGQRMAVVSALADLAPRAIPDAVSAWSRLLPQAAVAGNDDPFATNSHFSLSYLQVIEVLAVAHVHPDRLLSDEGRARLDADEHRIRLKIHQELT